MNVIFIFILPVYTNVTRKLSLRAAHQTYINEKEKVLSFKVEHCCSRIYFRLTLPWVTTREMSIIFCTPVYSIIFSVKFPWVMIPLMGVNFMKLIHIIIDKVKKILHVLLDAMTQYLIVGYS